MFVLKNRPYYNILIFELFVKNKILKYDYDFIIDATI